MGPERAKSTERGWPGYHTSTLLKIYVYGYLNRVPSSRRLERECQRKVWLTGRLALDHKTLCEFRKSNGKALARVCREFVGVCRRLNLFTQAQQPRPGLPSCGAANAASP